MATVVHKPGPASKTLEQALAEMKQYAGKVGWFEDAKYLDGTQIAMVASAQEFGTGKIPPRSFMRTTSTEQAARWRAVAHDGAKKILDGKMTTKDAIERVCLQAVGDVKKKIASIMSPPLKPETVKARIKRQGLTKKKSLPITIAKPLVDTGEMLARLTHKVEKK